MMKRINILLFLLPLFASGQIVIDSYRYVDAIVNVYDGLNAADPENEVDGIANTSGSASVSWYSRGPGEGTGNPGAQDGSYFLELVHEGGTDDSEVGYITLNSVSNTDNVTITIMSREDNGNFCKQFNLFSDDWSTTDSQNLDDYQTWTEFTLTGVASKDNPRIFFNYTSCADNGMVWQIDNIVVTIN